MLISRVDFAGDRAKRTGAMTDLHAYQTATIAAIQEEGSDHDLSEFVTIINRSLDSELKLNISGNDVIFPMVDPWGREYKLEFSENPSFIFSCAGPDGVFETSDDSLVAVGGIGNEAKTVAYTITDLLFAADFSLEKCSWEEIATFSECGLAQKFFAIGDTKTVNSNLTVRIVGFNHDDLAGGGKAGISFVATTSRYTVKEMFQSGATTGGWAKSDMREHCNGTIFEGLPQDLKTVIKTVEKTSDCGTGFSLTTTLDKIWIPSVIELNVATPNAIGGQGEKYQFYVENSAAENRTLIAYSSGVVYYWTRTSHYTNSALSIGVVGDNYDPNRGKYIEHYTDVAAHIPVGFCI